MVINFQSLENISFIIFDFEYRLRFFFIKNIKIIFVVKLKKHMADISIFGIIIDKLCYKKKPYLIILFKIDKDLKIDIYYTILPFGLTIRL